MPRSSEGDEDDGWLMGFVIDANDHGSALEILDARDITAAAIASIRVPHRIPPGIHGAWLQSTALG